MDTGTMKKSVKLVLVLLIGIIATFYYVKAIEKKTTKDEAGVVKMASGISAGMTRNDVALTLTGNGFRPNDKSPSKKDPARRQVFFKVSSKSTFAYVRYDALVEYDDKDQLKTARFLKSNHSDGRDTSCVIVYEVPARTIAYSAQCPPDIQDF